MNTLRHTLLDCWMRCLGLLCLLGGATACSSGQEDFPSVPERPEVSETRVPVTLTLTNRAPQGTPDYELPEHTIQSLRVYAFRKDPKNPTLDRLEGYYYIGNLQDSVVHIPLILPTDEIDFYLLANEEAVDPILVNDDEKQVVFDWTDPTHPVNQLGPMQTPSSPTAASTFYDLTTIQVTPARLQSLTFQNMPRVSYLQGGAGPTGQNIDETGRIYLRPYLPMTAIHRARVTKNALIAITLERSVAKLELYFSKTGSGELYMGRGIYLYNEPAYGYLFPKTLSEQETIPVTRLEDTYNEFLPTNEANNPYYNNSFLHQLNGRILMKSGFPDEKPNDEGINDTSHAHSLDVNQIQVDYNSSTDNSVRYQSMPPRPVYLYANPRNVAPTFASAPFVSTQRPPTDTPKGYYLKILAHQHLQTPDNQPLYKKECFYVALPPVEANDHLTLYSVFTLSGYATTPLRCTIETWHQGGGDIEFN